MTSDNKNSKRDAETNVALGAFITVLGIAVLAGTFFAQTTRALTVNAIAGGILVAIGIGFWVSGSRAYKKLK